MTKLDALAKYLEVDSDSIQGDLGIERIAFTYRDEEYLVLTDSEADKKAKESILDSVWAFKPSFLEAHMSDVTEEMIEVIQKGCEDSTPVLLKLIDDLDHFVEDTIMCDGRGPFIGTYDSEENEIQCKDALGYKTYYIYRTN